jgi:hypothetical protein
MTRVFNENSYNYAEVNSVGGLHVWGNRGNLLLLYVPHDIITNIILALEARKFKFITMHGGILSRGYPSMQWFDFVKDL